MKLIPNPQTPADHLVNTVAEVLHEGGHLDLKALQGDAETTDTARMAVLATMKQQGLGRVSRV